MSEHQFKFSGQTYPGYKMQEAKSMTVQQQRDSHGERPINEVALIGLEAAFFGALLGAALSKVILKRFI